MSQKININVDQGSDYQTTFNVPNANNQPMDLTGYIGKAQFRKSYTSLKSYDFDVSVANGAVTLSLSSSVSSCIIPGRYLYDCKLTSPTGSNLRIAEGILRLNPQVTQ